MRWTIQAQPPKEEVNHLAQELGIPTTIASLLVQRDIKTFDQAKSFYRPDLNALHDPFLMKDMEKAVSRIQKTVQNNSPILVYGDYDVDGTCSVAMMASFLESIGGAISTYIPDRYKEGYGVSFTGIDYAADNEFSLIVALDCGVKAIEQVAYAKDKGIDFIICDHHRPGNELPDAVAVLDPKRADCEYPFKELCGCGVGFKLIQALLVALKKDPDLAWPYLDLVATAIGADIVPMVGENRTLAYFGLEILKTNPRPGFKALLGERAKEDYTITDLVFGIAPRINAAGRMKHGDYAVALLLAQEELMALEMAQEIEEFNTSRREADAQITQEALSQIVQNKEENNKTTVVFDPNWHKGVIGIVASRLIETYYRPTLVFTKSGDVLAASARSVKGFDVYQAIAACSNHLIQFGGHKYAAGLTIEESSYHAFKSAFETQVASTINSEHLEPEVRIDLVLNLNDITPKFYRLIKQLAPFGPQNMTPVFLVQGVKDAGWAKTVGNDDSHLKATFQADGVRFGAIGFGLGDKLPLLQNSGLVDIAFCLDENHWQGKTSLQLRLKDIKAST